MSDSDQHWFHNRVIYQIYPRSFSDASGDGVGDLQGIIQKMGYLNGETDSLGVNAIWLSPFYPSPMIDFGYDITDHCGVDPLFGTIDDFKELLAEAHRRDIKVMVDLIPNHTSTQHPWFLEAQANKISPKRQWYTWHDPKSDGSLPNNWLSAFGGSAWELDEASGQYYLHSFLKQQADLNWDNPEVREAIKDIMRFWLDLGVDGFRVDAVSYISKDPELHDDLVNPAYKPDSGEDPYRALLGSHSRHGKQLFPYLQELCEVVKSYPDRFMVFEAYPDSLEDADRYYDAFYQHVDPLVSAPFNFEAIAAPWDAAVFQKFITSFQKSLHANYTPVYSLGNHDRSRLASRLGRPAARTAALLLLTLPGMPMIYYGDELGMEDVPIAADKVSDPFEKSHPGIGLGRDPERTPLQWSAEAHAGFSTVGPWLPVAADYAEFNIASEMTTDDSFLKLYRQLLGLRKDSAALRHGSYHLLDTRDGVFGYRRQAESETLEIYLNFTNEPKTVSVNDRQVRFSTHGTVAVQTDGGYMLRPYEGIIVTRA